MTEIKSVTHVPNPKQLDQMVKNLNDPKPNITWHLKYKGYILVWQMGQDEDDIVHSYAQKEANPSLLLKGRVKLCAIITLTHQSFYNHSFYGGIYDEIFDLARCFPQPSPFLNLYLV